jgi:hypothetical protein
MKPDMQVVELKTQNHLLVGSITKAAVKQEDYYDETMEDL